MKNSLIPYNFKDNLSKFRRELLLIGVTYYERLLVFEHLNQPITQVLNFPVTSIELAFNKEQMVSVWILIKNCTPETLLNCTERKLGKKAITINRDENYKIDNKLLYTWSDGNSLLGIGTRNKEESLFIYFTPEKSTFY